MQLGAGYTVRWAIGIGNRADKAMILNVPLVQKYLNPLTLTQAKQKDLQTYVPHLVSADIYNLYWTPILNAVPSTDSDDDENV